MRGVWIETGRDVKGELRARCDRTARAWRAYVASALRHARLREAVWSIVGDAEYVEVSGERDDAYVAMMEARDAADVAEGEWRALQVAVNAGRSVKGSIVRGGGSDA